MQYLTIFVSHLTLNMLIYEGNSFLVEQNLQRGRSVLSFLSCMLD